MRRLFYLVAALVFMSAAPVEAGRFEGDGALVTKSQYFELYAPDDFSMEHLLNELKFEYFLSLDAYFVGEIRDLNDLLCRTIDAIFLEINDSLGLSVENYSGTIRFLKDHNELNRVFQDIFKVDFNERAFYFYEGNTIYISLEDITLGMLGHEMAHAIISHYFVVPPPKKLQEVLSGYVEFKLRKATNDLATP